MKSHLGDSFKKGKYVSACGGFASEDYEDFTSLAVNVTCERCKKTGVYERVADFDKLNKRLKKSE
jgi:hypothetical protein